MREREDSPAVAEDVRLRFVPPMPPRDTERPETCVKIADAIGRRLP
jgi:hypothetical protein